MLHDGDSILSQFCFRHYNTIACWQATHDADYSDFKPDFIFWLRRGDDYHIVFVDPKGIEHTDYERKIDGYRALFEEDGKPRVLPHEGLRVRVHTYLYTENASLLSQGYEDCWLDNIGSLLARLDS